MKRMLILAALAVSLASGASAGSLKQIEAAKTLRIGTEGTYAPFTFHNASGALVGFDVEIGPEVAKRLGVEPVFVEGKWDGLIAGLAADRYDAVINQVGITEERKARFDFSDPYIVSKAVLIVKQDDDAIKGFADLKGKRAAQSLTSNYGKLAEGAGATLVGTDGFDQSIQLVLTGRADATINDNLSFLDFKKQKPDAPVKIAATQDEAAASGIIVQKNNPELVAAVNKALAGMKSDGTYEKISQTYFGADVSR
ncbi:amino acid ABC transporter substrate-binding protein [Aureimonas sp. AU20]|uniref:amino acid ABC transporter substrate-binding protein n=1 Tax=Aureimonas sp. AU20 TaxID=1349819 RepID=UPI000721DEE3|nr:amino acid ABC transporter substrate-binding protein [Aureimonas sp. AU20]ALN72804.1 amino acid ABC transporter substrate-binding protein [Aureimonas sp. AU20]